jgi:uncharacterized protein (DUF1697 family)
MATYVSMLRGINVGGQRKIMMGDLKDLYQFLDFKDVKTYIQSGNVVFQYIELSPLELASQIEKKIKEVYDFEVAVIIRTKDELQKIIENNPFKNEDVNKLYITFLSETPSTWPITGIEKKKHGSEKFVVSEKEIYLFIPGGYGRTKLSNDFFEKKLNLSTTTRNWKTVNKLFEIAKYQNEF